MLKHYFHQQSAVSVHSDGALLKQTLSNIHASQACSYCHKMGTDVSFKVCIRYRQHIRQAYFSCNVCFSPFLFSQLQVTNIKHSSI